MTTAALAASDLSCQRGDRVLFRGLSFDLKAGEALQVAGSNGIGKSSLIRIIAGLLRPFAGTVESQGMIGLLDERPALDPHLPLGKALAFWGGIDPPGQTMRPREGGDLRPATRGSVMRPEAPAFAGEHEAVIQRLGLANLLDVPVRYLSTGQKKRAALARLIGQSADLWLLDEPLNGLDTAAVATVEALIADHCAGGGIALVASHQPINLPGVGPGAQRIELLDFAA